MGGLIDRLLSTWGEIPDDDEAAVAAFAALYAEPVSINGTDLAVVDIVARARELHAALADITWDVVDRVESVDGDKAAFAFRLGGRHVGILHTPLGDLAPTGRWIESIGIDLLTIVDGRVTTIWVTHDELGRLARIGAVSLTPSG
jgi:hypothetical protein